MSLSESQYIPFFSLLDAEGYPECVISDFLSFSVILEKKNFWLKAALLVLIQLQKLVSNTEHRGKRKHAYIYFDNIYLETKN